jgi:hypothetical protein
VWVCGVAGGCEKGGVGDVLVLFNSRRENDAWPGNAHPGRFCTAADTHAFLLCASEVACFGRASPPINSRRSSPLRTTPAPSGHLVECWIAPLGETIFLCSGLQGREDTVHGHRWSMYDLLLEIDYIFVFRRDYHHPMLCYTNAQ